MDKRLKQRLVGATVLVALAVIIVPELIRWPAEPEPPTVSTTIPPQPETLPADRGVTISLPSPVAAPPPEPPPEPSPVADLPAPEPSVPEATPEPALPALPAEPTPVAREVPEPPPSPPVRELPEPTGAAVVTPAPRATPVSPPGARPTPPLPTEPPPPALPEIELIARSQSPTAPAPAPAPAPTPSRAAPAAAGWMVQTGSFALPQNANVLRNRLQAQGYAVIVEPIQAGGRTLHRVRVGPQNSRDESERVVQRLRQMGIGPAQVVPPGE